MRKYWAVFFVWLFMLAVLWLCMAKNASRTPQFEPFDLPKLDAAKLKAREQDGEALFVKLKCLKCHSFRNYRKPFTSSLNHLKEKAEPGFAKAWLDNPHKMKPGVKMPRPKASESEILSLLYFLYSETDTK